MKDISNTTERIKFALKQMKKAMPIVRQQVAVYERNMVLKSKKDNLQDFVISRNEKSHT